MDMNLSKLWEILKDREACGTVLQSMGLQRVRPDLVTEQQQKAWRKNGLVIKTSGAESTVSKAINSEY